MDLTPILLAFLSAVLMGTIGVFSKLTGIPADLITFFRLALGAGFMAGFLVIVRQTHLLPVREGLEADPMQYVWSSHRAYCGRDKVIWLNTERTFLQVEETGIRALMKFHSYVK